HGQSPSLLMGIVRSARDGAPVVGANVSAAWDELSFTAHGIGTTGRHPSATSGPNGWFAMCGVPTAGLFLMQATSHADSSDVVELTMPGDGFLRRDVMFGRGAPAVRISGVVVSNTDARPIPGAQVHVAGGGASARTDAQG